MSAFRKEPLLIRRMAQEVSKLFAVVSQSSMRAEVTLSLPQNEKRCSVPSLSLPEKRELRVQRIIQSLPQGASSSLATLSLEIPFFKQQRPCDFCGTTIRPCAANAGMKRFCDQSCSTKWWMSFPEFKARVYTKERSAKTGRGRSRFLNSGTPEANRQVQRIRELNPMISHPGTAAKVSASLRAIGHKPPVRGGNGTGLTRPQSALLKILGQGWTAEAAITLGGRIPGYPTCYKVDLGNREMMLAIECDGNKHCSPTQRAIDSKKDQKLGSLGWTVLRFSNKEILDWMNSGMPTGSSISTIFRRHGISHSASLDC